MAKAMALGDTPTTAGVPGWLVEVGIGVSRLVPDAIMKVYVPNESLVIFDIIPPRQYVGAKAFRKDWEDFLTLFKGPLKYEINDLQVEADGTLGYSHSIQRVSGTDTKGQPVDFDLAGHRRLPQSWRELGDCP